MNPRRQFILNLLLAVGAALATRFGLPLQLPPLPVPTVIWPTPAPPPPTSPAPVVPAPVVPVPVVPAPALPLPPGPGPIPPPVVPPMAEPSPRVVTPAPVPPLDDPMPSNKPEEAIVKINFGNSFCTGTILFPRRKDGKWNVLCASHCVKQVGQMATACLSDKCLRVRVIGFDRKSDCSVLETDGVIADLPSAKLAAHSPPVSTAIWHQGFGVDKPGNHEDGKVLGQTTNGQLEMRLSVSHGDSGAAVFAGEEVIACVCCTSAFGRRAVMFGASVESIRKLLATLPN